MPSDSPSAPARSPLPRVGVRIPSWATFTTPVFEGILDYMRLHGRWSLRTENNAEGELETVRIDAGWTGDGLITFRCSAEEAAAWAARGVAVVNISGEGETGPHPRVIPDNADIGRLAAEHLTESGLTSFAFLGRAATQYVRAEWAPGPRRYARERLASFSATLATKGFHPASLMLPPRPYEDPATWLAILEDVKAFLAPLPRPCGIFAADDPLAAVVIRAAESLGLRVPEDVAVVGFGDDAVFCHLTTPALSSVCYPGRELGFEAARVLARKMVGITANPAETLIPVTRVKLRESSDFLAIPDREVARLVRLIRQRAPSDTLQVAELLDHSTLSASTMKARFNAALGHGPKKEILLTRIRHLRHLLADSNLSVEAIARSMGFPSGAEMSRFLERHTGEKPAAVRGRGREYL